eukprot:3940957-Rhodomonas_salina.3
MLLSTGRGVAVQGRREIGAVSPNPKDRHRQRGDEVGWRVQEEPAGSKDSVRVWGRRRDWLRRSTQHEDERGVPDLKKDRADKGWGVMSRKEGQGNVVWT